MADAIYEHPGRICRLHVFAWRYLNFGKHGCAVHVFLVLVSIYGPSRDSLAWLRHVGEVGYMTQHKASAEMLQRASPPDLVRRE